jgi:tetratricopeptide (TPR) repeat protein
MGRTARLPVVSAVAGQSSRIAEALAAFRRGEFARARALAQAQLEAEQGPPEADHLLGLIECREGRMESGIEHLRAALDSQPDNAAFRVMLARALVDSGRPQEAVEIAIAPREANAAALALWHIRAEAAQAAADHVAAAEAWAVVSAARPDDWRGWSNYGEALAGLEQWDEAATALRKALALNPGELSIQLNFAGALTKAGFYAEATDQLRAMMDQGADDAGTRLTLSRLLADVGRHQDSMEQLDHAARLAVGGSASGQGDRELIKIALPNRTSASDPLTPEEFRALQELALLLERTSRMDALRTLLDDAEALGIPRTQLGHPAAAIALREGDPVAAKHILEQDSNDTDPVRRHRLMAKILEALGDAPGAFAEAQAMNHAVNDFAGWVRLANVNRQRLRAFADAITADWAAKLRPLEPGKRRSPAFLVGFPRSGTTLLDTFLMGHPETRVLEEYQMLPAARAVLGDAAGLPNRPVEQLENARSVYLRELDRHVDADFSGLVVDKLPLNMQALPVIYSLFPDARVIFAQRHPCDCVLSGFMQSFTLSNSMANFLTIEGAAGFYDVSMELFTASARALPLAVHHLVYERLIADPEAELRPLMDFLELEWRPELLDHRTTAKARGAIITPSYDQVVAPLSKAPSGRWRRYEKQLEPVLPVLLPWAERLGYGD